MIKIYNLFENINNFKNKYPVILEVYHGSMYNFDIFRNDIKNISGHLTSGIYFTDKYELAKEFANVLPIEYYDKLKIIEKKYKNIKNILKKIKNKEYQNKLRNPDDVKKEAELFITGLNKSWKEDKNWLYNNDYNLFIKRNSKGIDIIKKLENEYNHIINYNSEDYELTENEKKEYKSYNIKLKRLYNYIDNKYGYVYTVLIGGNEIIKIENAGFGSGREQEIYEASEKHNILKHINADTGKYLGTEYIVGNIEQVHILKKEKV